MGRPIPAFLDEVVDFLDEEVLLEVYNERYYYDKCVVRPNYDEEVIKVRRMSFCERNESGEIHRVNDVLSDAEIRLSFHFSGDGLLTGTWTEILTSFSATLDVPNVEVPTALKWEQSKDDGKLKADERFDSDRVYIEERIDAKEAMSTAISEHLYRVVPEFRAQSKADAISPVVLKTMYSEESAILGQLERH